MIYADYNATTPLGKAAVQEMTQAMEIWGNPSSLHRIGREAAEGLYRYRTWVAEAIGFAADEVVFTSGGSEANTMALLGSYFAAAEPLRLLISPVEHSSASDAAEFLAEKGSSVNYLRITSDGALDLEHLETSLMEIRPHLVSVMCANNETGVVFPIPEIASLCRNAGALFHTDAVQALGKLPPQHWAGADFVSFSAHKIQGPKGAGALAIRKGRKLKPLHFGGSQEIKRRGGTENLIAVAGFAGAIKAMPDLASWERVAQARDAFEQRLQEASPVTLQGARSPRVANTSNVRFPGVPAEVLLTALDLDGVYVSTGAACSSGSVNPSHVLLAMGLSPTEAKECLRFSFGAETLASEVDRVSSLVINHVGRIRARRQNRAVPESRLERNQAQ